jgi:hypothetical protein
MQGVKEPFEPVFVDQRKKDEDDGPRKEDRKPVILVVPYVVSAKGEKCGAAESADSAYDKKFPGAEMSESEDIAEEILRRSGDEEQKEDEKGAFVMQKIVIFRHRLLFHKPLHKRPSECPGKQECRQGTHREPDRRKQEAENRTIEKPADEPRDLAGNGCGNNLQGLKKDKSEERDGAQRIKKRRDPLPVHKKLEDPGLVEDENQPKEKKKGRYPYPDVFVLLISCRLFYFSSLPGPLSSNAFNMSIGTGKMIVEFFSVAISVRVPRNLN